MKKYVKPLVALLLGCLLAVSFGVPMQASAIEPSLDKKCKLTVILRDPETNELIEGITLALYKVGDVQKYNGMASEPEPEPGDGEDEGSDDGENSDSGGDNLNEPSEPGVYVIVCDKPDEFILIDDIYYELTERRAAELEDYVQANDDINVIKTMITDVSGTAVFDELDPGLYLVTQAGDTKDYIMGSFLVMLPVLYEGDESSTSYFYDYHVIAKPKLIWKIKLDIPNDPNKPKKSKDPKEPNDPNSPEDPNDLYNINNPEDFTNLQSLQNPQTDSMLPQTGQLWWPVTVMSVVGLLCCGTGYWLKRSSDRAAHRQ